MNDEYMTRRLRYEYTIAGMRLRWGNGTQTARDIKFDKRLSQSIKESHRLKMVAYLERVL